MMKSNFFCLTMSSLVLTHLLTYPIYAKPTQYISKNPSIHFTLKNNDCYTAPTECLLAVTPSKWTPNNNRTYDIEKICNHTQLQFLYSHISLSLQNQLIERKFLARRFCNGITTMSDMDLPFLKVATHHINPLADANDGLQVLNILETQMKSIENDLKNLQSLAFKASVGSHSENEIYQKNLTLMDIDIIANSWLNKIILLNGSTPHLIILIHQGTDRIIVPLFNATTSALNLSNISLESPDLAQNALESIHRALFEIQNAMENTKQIRQKVELAAKQDATITTIDLTGPQFVVHQEHALTKPA